MLIAIFNRGHQRVLQEYSFLSTLPVVIASKVGIQDIVEKLKIFPFRISFSYKISYYIIFYIQIFFLIPTFVGMTIKQKEHWQLNFTTPLLTVFCKALILLKKERK